MEQRESHISKADAESPLFLGIDVGGTNIKLGLVDNRGRTLSYGSVSTDADHGAQNAVERIATGVDSLLQQAGADRENVAGAGLATPGPIDLPSGTLLTPGNLPEWWNFPIRERVSEACRLPVRFANDANAAAYGEFWCGAATELHSMVLLTLGTGIGGGIIIGDLLIEGAHSCGSECGHILLDPSDDAPRDSLGKSGSLEAYCGSYGLIARVENALQAGQESSLRQLASREEEMTPLDIARAAETGPYAWMTIY